MSITESLNRRGHQLVDLTTPNPNRNSERRIAQPLPALDISPVNEPGSNQPLTSNTWFRLIGSSSQPRGLMFLCRCGQNNAYLFGNYDLRRELEKDHPCRGRCVSIIEKSRDENGNQVFEQVRATEKDEKGSLLPLGAMHNLLDILPNRGRNMSERERNLVYSTLPTWRLYDQKQASPFVAVGDHGGNIPGESSDYVGYEPTTIAGGLF